MSSEWDKGQGQPTFHGKYFPAGKEVPISGQGKKDPSAVFINSLV